MPKVSWKNIFVGFQLTVLIEKRKSAYNHSDDCKARQVLRDLFSTNQRNGSDVTFVATTKINLKNLKA